MRLWHSWAVPVHLRLRDAMQPGLVLLVAAGVGGSLLMSAALRRIGLAWVFDGPKLPTWARKRSSDSPPV